MSLNSLIVFYLFVVNSLVSTHAPNGLHTNDTSTPYKLRCDYYNRVKCLETGKGCGEYAEICASHDGNEKTTLCYAIWYNSTDNGFFPEFKGCWVGSIRDCSDGSKCIETRRKLLKNRLFCCCEGDLCNANISYVPLDNKSVNADIYEEVRNSRNFTGKVVLVTGSSSGIGEATAKLFSSLGANVVITGRNQTNIKRVALETQKLSPYGLKPLQVVADLTKDGDVFRLVNETITEFGQIDVLVNNAGSASTSYITDKNILSEYDQTFNIDLRAPVYLSHLSIPYLQKSKGTIINISSIYGLAPGTGSMVYNMAKAALDMFTKQLAVELGSSGIRVNTINPGYIETNIFSAVPEDVKKYIELKFNSTQQFLNIIRRAVLSTTPLNKLGEPIDVAKAVVFLASNDAQYITGANIVVDGGQIYNTPANFFDVLLNSA